MYELRYIADVMLRTAREFEEAARVWLYIASKINDDPREDQIPHFE